MVLMLLLMLSLSLPLQSVGTACDLQTIRLDLDFDPPESSFLQDADTAAASPAMCPDVSFLMATISATVSRHRYVELARSTSAHWLKPNRSDAVHESCAPLCRIITPKSASTRTQMVYVVGALFTTSNHAPSATHPLCLSLDARQTPKQVRKSESHSTGTG